MRGPSACRAAERGFTLLELVIASTILMLALLLASGLLVESARVFASAARELREPDDALALRQLAEDLRAAAPVFGGSADRIDAVGIERTVRWELVGERLDRRLFDASGADLGARPMLDQVVTFRWQPLGAGVVRVELVRRRPKAGAALRAATAHWSPLSETLESATLVVGSRQVWGASW